jgi:hypothetical protein
MRVRRFAAFVLSVLLSAQAIAPVPVEAFGGKGPKIPSPSKVAKEMEQRYNINLGSVQDFSQSFNVSNQKKTVPEVSIFFSPTDPREGQKITAKAFPMYFSNESSQLYYTWYLKQAGCELGPAAGKPGYCNADGAGGITVNDWKVAAARMLATDGADKSGFDYASHTDDDGYHAELGGGNKKNTTKDWCYLYDSNDGNVYELVSQAVSSTFSCPAAQIEVCLAGSDTVDPATFNANASADALGNSAVSITGDTFQYTSTYDVVGSPECQSNSPVCPSGTAARCVPTGSVNSTFTEAQYNAFNVPTCNSGSVIDQQCVRLFPRTSANGHQFGGNDGQFTLNNESFWGTNPNDPDTADNGGKDEANVIGLGRDTFAWNYQVGDMLGLVVEGTSMIPTKHEDASSAIMWAFSRNDCPVINKGSYSKSIKGYSVAIPTTTMTESDLNACLEDNLIDPLEGGQGSSKKLELDVSATPDNPTNDETAEKGGDIVTASVSIANSSRPRNDIRYEWKVSISDNPNGGWQDITAGLVSTGLLQNSIGNGLNSISVALNMQSGFLTPLGLNGTDPLYLRLAPTASENFSSGVSRSGTSDVIVRISNTTNKIVSYSTNAALNLGTYKVSYDQPICNDPFIVNPLTAADAMQNLNRIACRAMKNEIIGLKFSNEVGLSNFQWTLNGAPITCSTHVSAGCGNGVFFAVAGNAGETYTIKASAVNTTTGKSVTLARTFQIVEPEVVIESDDPALSWPKYVGTHTDLDGNAFDEYSDISFETEGLANIKLKARFLPGPAKFASSDLGPDGIFGTADDVSRRVWMIDGVEIPETAPGSLAIDYTPVAPKLPGEVYNISFYASLVQPMEKRQALKTIWGIDTLASSEIKVSQGIQMDVIEIEYVAQGPKKFFAAISSYLPASILFAFKITLSMALLLFTVGFVFALIPAEPRTDEVILSRRRG